MSFVLLKNRNGEYTASKLSFSSEINAVDVSGERESNATIGNSEFLDQDVVIAGLAKVCNIDKQEAANLLNGSSKISDLSSLGYSILVKESEKVVNGDYYYYKLQNGVIIFGLNETHEVIKCLESADDVKVTLNSNVLSNIRATSRDKRKRMKRGDDTHVSTIKIGDKEHEIHLTEQVLKYELIELNEHLVDEPKILSSKEGWIAMLLDKHKTLWHKRENREFMKQLKK